MKKLLAVCLILVPCTASAFFFSPGGGSGGGGSSLLCSADNQVGVWDNTTQSFKCGTPAGAGDVLGGLTSAVGEMTTYADTGGKLIGRSLFVLAGPASTAKTYTFPNANATMRTSIDPVVMGPASATDSYFAYFDGTTGKLLKDGQSSVNPAFSTLNVYGTNSLNLGTASSLTGQLTFKNGTNSNTFLIAPGTTGANISWTLPTAVPAGNGYLVTASTAGVLTYTDPSTIGGSGSVSDNAYNASSWDGVTTTAPSMNAVRDKFETLGTASTQNVGTLTDTKTCIYTNGVGIVCNTTPQAGGGDFSGPAASTDNALVIFDGTGGKTGKNSACTVGTDNSLSCPGGFNAAQSASTAGAVKLYELSGNGTNFVGFAAPDSVTEDYQLVMPAAKGTANQILKLQSDNVTLAWAADATGGSPTFDQIGTGSNTTATMTVGTGGSLAPTGSGTITATSLTGTATGTSLLVTGRLDGLIQVNITATSTDNTTISSTSNKSAYYFHDNTATTFNLPTAAAGLQYCFKNYTGRTGALTIQTSAAGQYIDLDGTNTATGGFIHSGGAAGDAACVIGADATHWVAYIQKGTWALD